MLAVPTTHRYTLIQTMFERRRAWTGANFRRNCKLPDDWIYVGLCFWPIAERCGTRKLLKKIESGTWVQLRLNCCCIKIRQVGTNCSLSSPKQNRLVVCSTYFRPLQIAGNKRFKKWWVGLGPTTGWWFQIFLEFSPRSSGKWSNLTSIFFKGVETTN